MISESHSPLFPRYIPHRRGTEKVFHLRKDSHTVGNWGSHELSVSPRSSKIEDSRSHPEVDRLRGSQTIYCAGAKIEAHVKLGVNGPFTLCEIPADDREVRSMDEGASTLPATQRAGSLTATESRRTLRSMEAPSQAKFKKAAEGSNTGICRKCGGRRKPIYNGCEVGKSGKKTSAARAAEGNMAVAYPSNEHATAAAARNADATLLCTAEGNGTVAHAPKDNGVAIDRLSLPLGEEGRTSPQAAIPSPPTGPGRSYERSPKSPMEVVPSLRLFHALMLSPPLPDSHPEKQFAPRYSSPVASHSRRHSAKHSDEKLRRLSASPTSASRPCHFRDQGTYTSSWKWSPAGDKRDSAPSERERRPVTMVKKKNSKGQSTPWRTSNGGREYSVQPQTFALGRKDNIFENKGRMGQNANTSCTTGGTKGDVGKNRPTGKTSTQSEERLGLNKTKTRTSTKGISNNTGGKSFGVEKNALRKFHFSPLTVELAFPSRKETSRAPNKN